MTDKKKAFLFYNNYYELIKHFSNEEVGILFKAILKNQNENQENIEELPPAIKGIYCYITSQMQIDNEKYINKCNKLAENRKGKTIDNKRKQLKTIDNKRKQIRSDIDIDIDIDNDIDNDIEKVKDISENSKKEFSDDFILFWNKYPAKRGSKKKSQEQYKLARKKTDGDTILIGLENYNKYLIETNTDEKYIKHCERWLRDEGYNDDYVIPEKLNETQKIMKELGIYGK